MSIIGNFSSADTPLVGSSSSSNWACAGHQRHGDVQQLAHAARQFGHPPVGLLGEA